MKLFGYSISLNVLILIGILYLIMVVNALSGTCNREGATSMMAPLYAIVNQVTATKQTRPLTVAEKLYFTTQLKDTAKKIGGKAAAKYAADESAKF
jgi:hypothetical protein